MSSCQDCKYEYDVLQSCYQCGKRICEKCDRGEHDFDDDNSSNEEYTQCNECYQWSMDQYSYTSFLVHSGRC